MMIETERFSLRPLAENDFADYKITDMDPEVMKFIRKASETEEEARKTFDRLLAYHLRFPTLGAFVVREKDSNLFLGLGVIIHIELKPENKDIEVGYRLARSAWGKGVATEVARGLIRYGFGELKLKEIFGTTHPDHVVSQKVLMKAGMKHIGSAPFYNGTTLFKITND